MGYLVLTVLSQKPATIPIVELFMTILIVSGNGGTFLVDVASAVSGVCLFLDSLTILHAFPMTSAGSLKVPLSLCPLCSLLFPPEKPLTCRIEKNLNWFASGSRAGRRGHVFQVAIAMSVSEMTE